MQNKYTWKDKIKAIGPGAVVTGSFVGPGTITTCTKAGAGFGFALLWAVLFSIIATIILQEMSARLGIITQKGLGEAILNTFKSKIGKILSGILVGGSVVLGCAAYNAGDLTGAALGLSTITGINITSLTPYMGLFVFVLLWMGSFNIIKKIFMLLVIIMALIFILTMFVVKPDFSLVFQGLLLPTFPDGSLFTIIAIIGTTIVPYNFFIHSATAKRTWKDASELELSKWDIYFSITTGGIITAAVVITAGVAMIGMEVKNASDMAIQLRPLLGNYAEIVLGVGIFAAGLACSISSPMGAAYVMSAFLGWDYKHNDIRFKLTCSAILLIGVIVSSTGFNPITLIFTAQILNGIILPVIVVYLVYITSSSKVLKNHKNSNIKIFLGIIIALISVILGGSSLISAIGNVI
ncbi:Nramp family divalent metal transporter [Campylobacter sp. RM12651]|uniref:Nramp family divalent metal transporter n=1 Tax=Campylobacter sp. RM12651 TaxID=1660079 RepID=UPI001EFB13D9|nr:Nramp family divalent metal transporter [Campylobacter sp. RM12651]ULO04119.1 divalent metal cation transporter, NRAMP family [Campylobacter sp. RM12651]